MKKDDAGVHAVTVLFPYLTDHDVFLAIYTKSLAKRLLHHQSDVDLEEQVVNVIGSPANAQLKHMFNDVKVGHNSAHWEGVTGAIR